MIGREVSRTGRPILAVGYPLGYTAPLDGSPASYVPYEVRLGDETVELSEPHWKLWLGAFAGADRPGLLSHAETLDLDEEALTRDLFDAGLLIALEDTLKPTALSSSNCGLSPRGSDSANTEEDRPAFRIGLPQLGVRVISDYRMYDVWRQCDGRRTLADACRKVARDWDVEDAQATRVAAANLALLLREGVIYLDVP